MNNMSKTAKFFIICAVIFCIGLVTAIAGFAAGGIKGLDKVAEKREWLIGSPGVLTADHIEADGFDKVEVKGDIDVYLATEKYFSDEKWQKRCNLDDVLGKLEGTEPKAGKVLVVRGEKVKAPEVEVKNGVLHIESGKTATKGLTLNLSTVSTTPAVYIFCTEDELKNIEADALSGDIRLYGISFDKASIDSASGDVLMEDVKGNGAALSLLSGDLEISGQLNGAAAIDSTSGDIDLSGKLQGDITINSASGDVEFDTDLASKEYKLNISALAGDLKITEGGEAVTMDEVPVTYKRDGKPNSLTIESLSGDIDLDF